MDSKAMQNISYGLYILSAKDGEKDNGCCINTLCQVTSEPNRVTIALNKANFTHDMIVKTGGFNVSMLDVTAPFDIIKNFGFQSGKDADKFSAAAFKRGENGICYLDGHINAYVGCRVVSMTDLGTHTLFLADVTEGERLDPNESMTYAYYHKNVKPKSDRAVKAGYKCSICGYIYEGEPLPPDFICPICKHPASDFVKI